MRILSEDEDYDDADIDQCPHCKQYLVELFDETSLDSIDDAGQWVDSITCPNCDNRIALVTTYSVHLAKFKE